MPQVDKIKVGSTTYDIGASGNSTNSFNNGDTAQNNANSWTNVNTLQSGETTSSIFAKISTMFKNIRYLYNVLGNGFSTSNTVTSQINGKAPTNHTHTTSQLPISNSQNDSTATIPTSHLIYDMNKTLTSLNDAIPKKAEDIGAVKFIPMYDYNYSADFFNNSDIKYPYITAINSSMTNKLIGVNRYSNIMYIPSNTSDSTQIFFVHTRNSIIVRNGNHVKPIFNPPFFIPSVKLEGSNLNITF